MLWTCINKYRCTHLRDYGDKLDFLNKLGVISFRVTVYVKPIFSKSDIITKSAIDESIGRVGRPFVGEGEGCRHYLEFKTLANNYHRTRKQN